MSLTPVVHTNQGEHIVAMFATRNLYPHLPAAYNSLLYYNPDVHLYLFIEDDTLPYDTPAHVTTVNVSGQTLFPPDGPCFRTRYTYMALMKAALTKLFPDASRAVVMDVDTITCGSISAMWEYDLSCAYYAAVTEPVSTSRRGVPYANFGFVLLNLDMLRTTGTDDMIISELNTSYHQYPEQDAFSKFCGNRFDPLDPAYNVTVPGFNVTGYAKHTIVRHFAGFHADAWSYFAIVRYWMTHTSPPPHYVVYAGDRRVYNMMLASAKSLLANTRVDKIFFLIQDDTIDSPSDPLPPVIQCINVSGQTVFPPSCPNIISWYGYMTTLRAGLTRILPDDVSTVLWLDPDTVVHTDISDLWNYELEYSYFAAVEEVRNHNHTLKPYFNAGVMLMNLDKFREDGMDDKVISMINAERLEHLEQDALNFCCYGHILALPERYSASYVSAPCDKPMISHFLAQAKNGFIPAVAPYEKPFSEIPNAWTVGQTEENAVESCQKARKTPSTGRE